MRKSDLVTVNDFSLTYDYSGIFDTVKPWIHGSFTLPTHELIYVIEGKVKIREGSTEYGLVKGDFIVLSPDIEHVGYEKSTGHTSFFWLHFFSDTTEKISLPKTGKAGPDAEKTLREINHLAHVDTRLAELSLAAFLIGLSSDFAQSGNKLAHETDEYIRINSDVKLTAAAVAAEFGFSTDYLSRVYRREFGINLKAGICRHRLARAENLLRNTNFGIKEVAELCGFDDENGFVKFFGYHSGVTPTAYRNEFYKIHMNGNPAPKD